MHSDQTEFCVSYDFLIASSRAPIMKAPLKIRMPTLLIRVPTITDFYLIAVSQFTVSFLKGHNRDTSNADLTFSARGHVGTRPRGDMYVCAPVQLRRNVTKHSVDHSLNYTKSIEDRIT